MGGWLALMLLDSQGLAYKVLNWETALNTKQSANSYSKKQSNIKQKVSNTHAQQESQTAVCRGLFLGTETTKIKRELVSSLV